jgi:hypothetical protein
MRKTIINPLALVISFLCLLALSACPPDTSPSEDTEEVLVTNLPSTVGNNNKTPFKVYVQLSKGMNASAGYVAKGEAKLPSGQTEVRIKLKAKGGADWTGSDFSNACVLISPEIVDTIDDIDAKPKAGATASKTLVLDWDSLLDETYINTLDKYSLAKLYNGIIVGTAEPETGDSEIKGTKTAAKDAD